MCVEVGTVYFKLQAVGLTEGKSVLTGGLRIITSSQTLVEGNYGRLDGPNVLRPNPHPELYHIQ